MLDIKLDLLEIERQVHLEDRDVDGVIQSDLEIAEVLIELERWSEALKRTDGLEDLYNWLVDFHGQIRIHLVRARAFIELGDYESASKPIVDSQAMAAWSEEKVDWALLARVEELRALSHSRQGFDEDAQRIQLEVRKIREITNYEIYSERNS